MSDNAKDNFPDAWLTSKRRMNGIGDIQADLKTLESAYLEVLALEEYFASHSRRFECLGYGIDDFILLEASPSVGRLQAILAKRRVLAGGDKEPVRRDLLYLCKRLGYTLTAALWTDGDRRFNSDSPPTHRTNSLQHWISKEDA